ncbi:MAG: hypothetical protein HFF41_08250, partial [Lawsonibacter sp.]|nr:hypothetical protein [Lawsonibacter sp.]
MTDQRQLTQGPISRQLIALSAPLLAGNILQQLYNTVDAVIVGRFVGDSAFAAIGVAGAVMNLFLFLISGGCDGVGALLSQFYGGGGRKNLSPGVLPVRRVRRGGVAGADRSGTAGPSGAAAAAPDPARRGW